MEEKFGDKWKQQRAEKILAAMEQLLDERAVEDRLSAAEARIRGQYDALVKKEALLRSAAQDHALLLQSLRAKMSELGDDKEQLLALEQEALNAQHLLPAHDYSKYGTPCCESLLAAADAVRESLSSRFSDIDLAVKAAKEWVLMDVDAKLHKLEAMLKHLETMVPPSRPVGVTLTKDEVQKVIGGTVEQWILSLSPIAAAAVPIQKLLSLSEQQKSLLRDRLLPDAVYNMPTSRRIAYGFLREVAKEEFLSSLMAQMEQGPTEDHEPIIPIAEDVDD